jgi:glucose/arabinose dehydrogenase
MKHIQLLLSVVVITCTVTQLANAQLTPYREVEMDEVTIQVPPKFASIISFSSSQKLRVPKGYTASVFFAAPASVMQRPRFMAFGPDSVLYVANMNRSNILALPDLNNDGIADTAVVAAQGFSVGHDVRFFRDTMFVAQTAGIVKLSRSNQQSYVFDVRQTLIDKASQPNQTGGNHQTRTLVIDSINNKLYVSVGSRANVARESNRAVIEQYDWTGGNRSIVATGVRNAVGMTLHPRTGKVWANNNGSDNQGNNTPPEWVDIVRPNGFYGYPIAYHPSNFFTFNGEYAALLPITPTDSSMVRSMATPGALVTAHCAPMALHFVSNTVPTAFRSTLLMAQRGSWNRNPPSGAKIVCFRFDSDQDTIANSVEDVCTGFITDTTQASTRWARPVGLEVDAKGAIYISVDDGKQMILKLSPPNETSIDELQPRKVGVHCVPNPAGTHVSFLYDGAQSTVALYSSEGNLVAQFNAQSGVPHSLANIPAGAYNVLIEKTGAVGRLVITR